MIVVLVEIAPLLRGWPENFIQTMNEHNNEVIILGPNSVPYANGINTKADLDELPSDIDAYVWTDQVDSLS